MYRKVCTRLIGMPHDTYLDRLRYQSEAVLITCSTARLQRLNSLLDVHDDPCHLEPIKSSHP